MITIQIQTGDDAFVGHGYREEIARILNELAARAEQRIYWPSILLDSNGNTCGHVITSGRDRDKL